jgi:molybdate transport system ATP-binding protein
VLIARALMQSPKLLIFDDPFRGLDASSQRNLRRTLDHLIESGAIQVLIITSRKEDIPRGISHILSVSGKKVVGQGPKEILLPSLMPDKRSRQTASGRFPAMDDALAGATPILIEMHQVSVTYEGIRVLNEITWSLRQGERWAVLGPNGAGKTTLLSLILADNPQGYANDLSLFGRKRGTGESIWEIKKRIGWVSPELQLYYDRNITCHQVVCSGFFDSIGLYRTCSADRQAVALQWMRSLSIDHLANQAFRSVSAGEQRLVLIARAMVKSPALLVLDEPCQGLDTAHRNQITSLLEQICLRVQVSLIYVTHQVEELPKAITHVLKLAKGTIASAGPIGRFHTAAASPITEGGGNSG